MNQSSRPLKDLLPLVEFVAARTAYADMAYLHVRPGQYDAYGRPHVARGMAEKANTDPAGTAPSRIDVWLARGVSYPRDDYYPAAEVGIIVLNDWKEEFILVLAHESYHVQRFWGTDPKPDNEEHAAETFGVQVLNEWRVVNGRAALEPIPKALRRHRLRKHLQEEARAARKSK